MPTLSDVADAADVSPMTVSRYFNSPEMVKESTREAVREAVRELSYVPNEVARSLVKGNTKAISLIVADITNPFFTTLARGVEDGGREYGYITALGNTDENAEIEERYLGAMVSRQFDGIIIAPAPGSGENFRLLEEREIPVVLVDREVDSAEFDVVRGDTYRGARRLVEYLLDQGAQEIAFIGGSPETSSLRHRLAGYRETIEEAGLAPIVHLSDFTEEGGRSVTSQLLRAGEVPGVLVAANNLVAAGAFSCLRDAGLSVPEDVKLACFEDFGPASAFQPFLTFVRQPSYTIGQVALELLLERIDGYQGPPRSKVLPTELIIGRSTGGE